MTTKDVKRKLRAILSADVQGYSRLMGDDEVATVRTITEYRETLTSLVNQYTGRVVDSPGDNVLAVFGSVVDAVQCAVEIQNVLKAKNEDLPENRKMIFRIGVNLGDVIQEGDRIYGDGVNIAARIESLADGGGICISGTAYDHIENKLALGYNFMGKHSVKNIAKPVRVYRVPMDPKDAGKKRVGKSWKKMAIAVAIVLILGTVSFAVWNFYLRPPQIEPASVEKMAFPLPNKPSIAVLPFNNLSGDPTQDYIADGISENIISTLSKVSEMFVIASNSTFTYKGKPVKVQQVSEELGVRYVLEGSAQKIGNRVRITAQLIDATTGHHLWSEKYDRDMKDLFALQDEIAHKIIVELQVKLTEGEQARVSHKSTTNLEAWSYAVRGLKLFERPSKENNAKAMELFERAVELDPNYVWAWVRLAWTHVMASIPGWSPSPSEHWKKVVEISEKVLVLDESDSDVHALLGLVYRYQRRYEEAISEGEKSLVLGPTNAQAHVLFAVSMNTVGRFDDAIRLVKKAMRLHPYYPAYYLQWLGGAYRMTGRYEEALTVYNQLLDRSRKGEFGILSAHVFLADIYAELGKEDEARNHVAQVIKIEPGFSLKDIQKIRTYRYKDPAHLERRLNALRKAEIPEAPPLPLPDKPSIAVLPFVNMSDDPKQEYFVDGMTDDLITDLSKLSGILVIARNSTFTYKGKQVKVQKISQDLGARYVVEGSVRKAGNDIRINAQLIDATTGHHLWAERYDGKLQNIFALQDEITRKIVSSLAVKLGASEQKDVKRPETESIEAYDAFLKGYEYYFRGTVDDAVMAISYFEKAIELDQNYGRAYATLAKTYFLGPKIGREWYAKTGLDFRKNMARARHYLQMANKKPTSTSHQIASLMALQRRQYKKALAEAELALSLEPNGVESNFNMGCVLVYLGRAEEGIGYLKRSIELDPLHPGWALFYMGLTRFSMGQFDEAVELINRALTYNPKTHKMSGILAAAYGHLGRAKEAHETLQNYLRGFYYRPDLNAIMSDWPFSDPKVSDRLAEGLIKAGLPGQASDYCRVLKENKLTREEIRKLMFGRTRKGLIHGRKESTWSIICTKDGKVESMSASSYDTGKSWIEGDSLFAQFETRIEGRKFSGEVYRNPDGTPQRMNEYFIIFDFGIFPFSVEE